MLWIAAGVVLVVIVIAVAMRSGSSGPRLGGASFPPGTRAFEAEMSLGIIATMIEAREIALASADAEKRADIERQLSNLRRQAQLHRATVDARDVSPGKMSIGVNPDSDTID